MSLLTIPGSGKGKGEVRTKPVASPNAPNALHPPKSTEGVPSGPPNDPKPKEPKLRKQDWSSDVLSPAQVYAKIGAGSANFKAVVPIFSSEQLEELATLSTAHADLALTAVSFNMFAWTKCAAESADPSTAVVQCFLGTATVSREVRLHRLGKDCPSINQVVRKATGVQKPTDTVVLRFVADARYLTDGQWDSLKAKPAASIRSWAAAHAPADVLSIKDMWGFKVSGGASASKAVLSGLVRVQARKADAWLTLSGRDKWFVENPAARAPISWVKRQKDEPAKDYLDRVFAQCKGRGVAKGDTGLGVRLSAEEASTQPRSVPLRAFKIWPVPLDWTQETLEHELTQFKFNDLTLLARYPCKGGVKFFYRARVENLDLAVIEHDKGAIQVVLQNQTLRRGAPTPIRAGRGAFTASAASADRPMPAAPAPAAEVPVASAPAEGRPPIQDAPAKRQAVAAPAAAVHELPSGLTRKPNPGQGDCLFYALEVATGQNKLALRTAIVAHLRRHSDHYKRFWSCLAPTRADEPMTDWDTYLEALAKPGAYTSLLEIHAAAKHLDMPIYIYSDVQPLQVCNREGKRGPIILWYSAAHYELVEGELPAKAATSAINAPKSGCKGGAQPSDRPASVGSEVSGHTRLSAFTAEDLMPKSPNSPKHRPPFSAPKRGSEMANSEASCREGCEGLSVASGHTRLSAFTAQPASQGAASRSTKRRGPETTLPGQLSLAAAFANSCVPSKVPAALSEVTGHLRPQHDLHTDVANLRDLDDCVEPEAEAPAPVGCKRKRIQWVKREGWECPICKWSVHARHWRAMKQTHINRWHPHLRKWLRLPRVLVNPRVFGLRHATFVQDARRRAANVKKSAAISKHLHKAKTYQGPHVPQVIRIPMPPQGTHTRTGQVIKSRLVAPPTVVCSKCTRKESTLDRLAQLPCSSTGVGGPKRAQLLHRLLSIVEDCDAAVELREQAATAFRLLSPPSPEPTSSANKPHVLLRLNWPLPGVPVGQGKGPCAFCTVCLASATRLARLRQTTCPGRATWSAMRQVTIRTLQEHLPHPKVKVDTRIRRMLARLAPAEGGQP